MIQAANTDSEIQLADPAARKRAIWIAIVAISAAGVLALVAHFKEGQVVAWLTENSDTMIRQPGIVFAVVFIAMLPLVCFSAYMFNQARKIIRSERIPPPGQKVIKDTPVITGRKALRQGRILRILTIIMTVFFLLVPFWVVMILMTLSKSI